MKYAFMSFSCPDLEFGAMLDLARRAGYDGVEPRITEGHRHGVEPEASPSARAALKQKAADAGVAVCCIATSCSYADPKHSERQVAETRQAIDLAADLGAPRIRVFGGQLAPGLRRWEAIRLLAESLGSVAAQAARRGVTVCLETHDDWCDPAHVAELMRRVHHPAIAVNWDIMHPGRAPGATVDEAFALLRPWIRHVHFHDGIERDGRIAYAALGSGQVDTRRAVELLEDAGYDGYLSGEWIGWEPAEQHLPRELKAIKAYQRKG